MSNVYCRFTSMTGVGTQRLTDEFYYDITNIEQL